MSSDDTDTNTLNNHNHNHPTISTSTIDTNLSNLIPDILNGSITIYDNILSIAYRKGLKDTNLFLSKQQDTLTTIETLPNILHLHQIIQLIIYHNGNRKLQQIALLTINNLLLNTLNKGTTSTIESVSSSVSSPFQPPPSIPTSPTVTFTFSPTDVTNMTNNQVYKSIIQLSLKDKEIIDTLILQYSLFQYICQAYYELITTITKPIDSHINSSSEYGNDYIVHNFYLLMEIINNICMIYNLLPSIKYFPLPNIDVSYQIISQANYLLLCKGIGTLLRYYHSHQSTPTSESSKPANSTLVSSVLPDYYHYIFSKDILELILFYEQKLRFTILDNFYTEDLSYQTIFNESTVLHTLLKLLIKYPQTYLAQHIAIMLQNGTNVLEFIEALLSESVNGFTYIFEAMASTVHNEQTIQPLLGSISNSCSIDDDIALTVTKYIIEKCNAFYMLQPALLSKDYKVCIIAGYTLATLASKKEWRSYAEKSGVYTLMLDVLRSTPFGYEHSVTTWSDFDVPNFLQLFSKDVPVACRLACLHELACIKEVSSNDDITNPTIMKQNNAYNAFKKLCKTGSSLLNAIRACAFSSDAFVYLGATSILRNLHEAIPYYREIQDTEESRTILLPNNEKLIISINNPLSTKYWTIEDVCEWINNQPFSQYCSHFRESLVTGRTLLTLSESDLIDVGIQNAIHRRTINLSIQELRILGNYNNNSNNNNTVIHNTNLNILPTTPSKTTTGNTNDISYDNNTILLSSPVPTTVSNTPNTTSSKDNTNTNNSEITPLLLSPTMLSPKSHYKYDVFISYRRVGGADFAQLLKIQLLAAGLEVFLDVENLGTGNFSNQLLSSLITSKNIILVWTKGCMDRFLDDNDPLNNDFVRLEYSQSLKLGKHIVPVYKDDFIFPLEHQLPYDVKGVLMLNAIKWVAEYREASFKKLKNALQLS